MSSRSHYEVLMVDPRADGDVIATVYRRLAKRYHPDRDPSPEARRRMVELNEAYEVLRDPQRRSRYDAELAATRTGTRGGADVRGRAVWPRSEEPGTDRRPRSAAGAGATERHTSATRATQSTHAAPYGEAGPPPDGAAIGSVLDFGRYRGWTLAQVARVDRDFLEWLRRTPTGRSYRAELDALLGFKRP
jgi:curved DNA-binding protein CbpA